MFRTSPTDCSKLILPDIDLIARETQLVVRKSSKFTPDSFLQSLLSAVATGKGSLNQIAAQIEDRVDQGMARQSLSDRFTPKSTAFLLSILGKLIEQRFKPTTAALAHTKIRRVFIEDSSALGLPKSNARNFPAHGNHHGNTAGVKIDFAYDLLSGNVLSHSLQQATTQDKSIGKDALVEVQAGDLVLRDMGYFSLDEFTEIESRSAWWLTRLPLSTGVLLENGKALETRLRSRKQDILDLKVHVGGQKKSCRLIAVRADDTVARKRRSERRKRAKENGKSPCNKGLMRDGWHLMLTNLCSSEAEVSQLVVIYRARWAVEIQFRAWKQSLNLEQALKRKSSQHHLEALMLAGMIAHQLGMKIAILMGHQVGRPQLSYERLYDLLAVYLIKVSTFMGLQNFAPDRRHISRGKRSRQSPIESGIMALN